MQLCVIYIPRILDTCGHQMFFFTAGNILANQHSIFFRVQTLRCTHCVLCNAFKDVFIAQMAGVMFLTRFSSCQARNSVIVKKPTEELGLAAGPPQLRHSWLSLLVFYLLPHSRLVLIVSLLCISTFSPSFCCQKLVNCHILALS
jgi:hypothetical protein